MTAINTFKFGEYFLRPADERDRQLAEQWTAMDPEHAGKIDPSFWLENSLGRDGFLLSDHAGPVYFFKMHILPQYPLRVSEESLQNVHNVVQVFIQFPPLNIPAWADRRSLLMARERLGMALVEGCKWLERTVQPMGAQWIVFDSENEGLIRFCVNRLGFTCSGNVLSKRLKPESEATDVRSDRRAEPDSAGADEPVPAGPADDGRGVRQPAGDLRAAGDAVPEDIRGRPEPGRL